MREVALGQHTVPVLEQPVPYLERKLGKTIGALLEGGGGIDGENFIRDLGWPRAYDVLSVLIPALARAMPKYEWEGYASQSAYESREDDDEALLAAPTHAQAVRAIEAVIAENRFDVYGKLGSLIDPKLLRARLSLLMAERMEASDESPSLPSPNGDSPPPKPSSTAPTSVESEVSHALASST